MVLYKIVEYLFEAMYYLLIARILLSWIPHNNDHAIVQFLFQVTDPILEPFRRLMPSTGIGIDFSPIIAFIVLGFLKTIVLALIAKALGL